MKEDSKGLCMYVMRFTNERDRRIILKPCLKALRRKLAKKPKCIQIYANGSLV